MRLNYEIISKEESKNNNKIPPVIILSAPFYNGKIIAVEMMPYLGYFNSNLSARSS